MKHIFQLILVLTSSALVCCVSEPAQHVSISEEGSYDSSLASAFYKTEVQFLNRQMEGDAHGMAIAAKARLGLLRRLSSDIPLQTKPRSEAERDKQSSTIRASVRDMVSAARTLAQDDEAALRKIERLFPSSIIAHADDRPMFSGIIGGLREVKLTIGLEFEASLDPLQADSVKLPVNGRDGTTIYVQPVGHEYIETTESISMSVSRRLESEARWEQVACPATSAPRLPCYIPPGEHNVIELSLENNGARPVELLVFISGNAETVSASIAQQAAIQPNRLDDE